MAGTWPLIGRDDELRHFADLLDRPDAGGMVLVGPAGVGKTRLALECLQLAAARGFACTRVVASRAASSIPFGALAPLLPSGTTAVEQGLTALRQVTLALEQFADGRRLLVLVDDGHSLDDASAVVLEQLAATRAAFLVVTVRSGESPPAPVTSLWKDHGLERTVIESLSRERADHFARTMLGDDIDPGTLAQLWAKTHGNPMFLRELVLGAVQDGSLACTHERWHAIGDLTPSDRLAELVGTRLAGLEANEIAALERVAFGEPLGLDLLVGLVDADAVDGLERAGLVMLQRNGRRTELRLAHPMYGEVLRVQTPAVRARSVRRHLAEAVEGTGARRREDALRVALWRLDGGGTAPQPLLVEGAAQALFANEYGIAHRLATTAYEREPSHACGLLLLEILYQMDRPLESEDLALRMVKQATNDRQRAEIAVMRSTAQFWKAGDIDASRAVIAEAVGSLEESGERDWVAAFGALVDVQSGDPAHAIATTEPLLQSPDPRTFVRGALSASLAVSIVGRCVDAIDLADRAFEARVELGQEFTLFQAGLLLVAKAVALNEAGRIDEAYEVATFTRLLASDAKDVSSEGFCGVALARICLTAGRVREAAHWAERAVDAFGRYAHPGPMRWALGYLGLATALLGEQRDAQAALDELDARPDHPARMLQVDIERARAWVAVGDGRLEAARTMLLAAAERLRTTGQASLEASALYDIARLGDARSVADRLAEIAATTQGELHPAMAATAAALMRNHPDELERATVAWERLGARLYAAETAVATADAHRRAGDQRRASEWSRRAADLVGELDGVRTPGLLQLDTPIPLTQREREVAILAAQGLTSRLIGERLFVASRTVDNHLARVYAKLGVTSRAELAEVLQVASVG